MCCLASVSALAVELDTYGALTDVKGKEIGFVHTPKIGDRFWLVSPDEQGFFRIGVSHPLTSFSRGTMTIACKGNGEWWLRDGIWDMRDLG